MLLDSFELLVENVKQVLVCVIQGTIGAFEHVLASLCFTLLHMTVGNDHVNLADFELRETAIRVQAFFHHLDDVVLEERLVTMAQNQLVNMLSDFLVQCAHLSLAGARLVVTLSVLITLATSAGPVAVG